MENKEQNEKRENKVAEQFERDYSYGYASFKRIPYSGLLSDGERIGWKDAYKEYSE
jgi:hypothetical protein